MSAWRPMEDAPRDGTRIVGWFRDRAIVVFWRSGPEYIERRQTGNTVSYWSDGYSRYSEPAAWQPEPGEPEGYCSFCEMCVPPIVAAACKKPDCPVRVAEAA